MLRCSGSTRTRDGVKLLDLDGRCTPSNKPERTESGLPQRGIRLIAGIYSNNAPGVKSVFHCMDSQGMRYAIHKLVIHEVSDVL